MKKIILAVWSVVIAPAITACGSSAGEAAQSSIAQADREELVAVWKAANEKTTALTSAALSAFMDINAQSGNEDFESGMNTEILLNEAGQENMACLWNTDTSLNGELSVETITFYADGYYYMDLPERKVKCALSPEQMEGQFEKMLSVWMLDPDCATEISIEEEADSRIITFTGDAGKTEEYLRRSMEYSKSPMAGMKRKIKKSEGEVVVDSQGYMKSQILKVELTLGTNGSQIDMTMNMKLIYHWPGESVSVELPSRDGYIEVDTESFLLTSSGSFEEEAARVGRFWKTAHF